ncbi:MAG: RIP metalloprotease RseP [Firmicutes bacterium]|nr:RIP metalloprotease RseP [Bacillota bacterium]
MKTALLAILLFCIMIFPHELGHFIAAKRVGVKVNEFAFGMGPLLWKKQGKETLYSIRLFPIGGYCAMEGEDEDCDSPRAFGNKKPWQKILVLAAGSFMNVLCAILIMIIVVGFLGFTTTTIDMVDEGSPAQVANVLPGDVIVQIDEMQIETWNDVSVAFNSALGKTSTVIVERDGNLEELKITPELSEDGRYLVGVTCEVSHNPAKAVVEGTVATWNMTKSLFVAIGQIFTGGVGVDNLSGPVGMVQMVNETTTYGIWYYGFLTAMICMNLAIVNMLPLPALDGGRIIFVLVTMFTGKEVSPRVEGTIHFIGIVLLLGLMVYVSFNDVIRIFG